MQVFLYLSVKNNDLNELNAINRLCEHLALNDKSLVLKASGGEFNHSYALYTYECGNYAELKERLKEAVCQKLFDFDALMMQSVPSLKTPGVLVMDMDMTSVQIEGIDEIARCLNVYDEVAAITGEAMHGRLDFASSLKKRVSLLKGGDALVLEKVKSIIVDKLGVDPSEVKETASFTNDLGADSLDTVELIMEFEKEFGITIPDEDAGEKIATVGDAIKYIESKLQ